MRSNRSRQVTLARCRSARWAGAVALLALASCPAVWQVGCAANSTTRSASASMNRTPERVDLVRSLGTLDATFVVRSIATGRTLVHRPERAATSFVPASTFKIPISIAALETGVANGPDFTIAWDPERYPLSDDAPESWKQDLTLRTGFAASSEWFYGELVRRIGVDRMAAWTERLGFGEGTDLSAPGRFWLDGRLVISALGQIDFLERFVRGELPISAATTRTMRTIMLLEESGSTRFFGKTGTSAPDGATPLGWLVGFVEHDGETYVYALNINHERLLEDYGRARRGELVRAALDELGLVPQ